MEQHEKFRKLKRKLKIVATMKHTQRKHTHWLAYTQTLTHSLTHFVTHTRLHSNSRILQWLSFAKRQSLAFACMCVYVCTCLMCNCISAGSHVRVCVCVSALCKYAFVCFSALCCHSQLLLLASKLKGLN